LLAIKIIFAMSGWPAFNSYLRGRCGVVRGQQKASKLWKKLVADGHAAWWAFPGRSYEAKTVGWVLD
jgi:hypothetical protein